MRGQPVGPLSTQALYEESEVCARGAGGLAGEFAVEQLGSKTGTSLPPCLITVFWGTAVREANSGDQRGVERRTASCLLPHTIMIVK